MHGFERTVAAAALLALVAMLGCSIDVEPPTDKPTTEIIKGASDSQIAAVEKAIEKKDLTLPSKARRLADYLNNLKMNITLGEGSQYGNTAQAAADIDRVIVRLQSWYERSLTRAEEGDTDEDRAELQVILDEAKAILAEVKIGGR